MDGRRDTTLTGADRGQIMGRRENEKAEERRDELNKRGYEGEEVGGSDSALNRTIRVLDRINLLPQRWREKYPLKIS